MFEKALRHTLRWEGGYVHDPRDPGGETKYGISKRSFPGLEIAALTQEDAERIYKANYWDRCRCEELPGSIAILLFDGAVNQGVGAAVRCLQQALGNVTIDGLIGPQTIGAACKADVAGLALDFFARRAQRYGGTRNFDIYGYGWMRRLGSCYALALEVMRG